MARKPSHLASYCMPGGIVGHRLGEHRLRRAASPAGPWSRSCGCGASRAPDGPAARPPSGARRRRTVPSVESWPEPELWSWTSRGAPCGCRSPDKVVLPGARLHQAGRRPVLPGRRRRHRCARLRDRPTTLERYPDGVEGESFFQKRAPKNTARLDPHRPHRLPQRTVRRRDVPHRARGRALGRQPGVSDLPPLAGAPRRHRAPRRAAHRPRPAARHRLRRRRPGRPRTARAAGRSTGCAAGPRPPAAAGCTSSCRSSRAGPSPRCGGPRSPWPGSWSAGCRSG